MSQEKSILGRKNRTCKDVEAGKNVTGTFSANHSVVWQEHRRCVWVERNKIKFILSWVIKILIPYTEEIGLYLIHKRNTT